MNNFCVYFLINRGNLAFHARMIFLATEKPTSEREVWSTFFISFVETRPGVGSSCCYVFVFQTRVSFDICARCVLRKVVRGLSLLDNKLMNLCLKRFKISLGAPSTEVQQRGKIIFLV